MDESMDMSQSHGLQVLAEACKARDESYNDVLVLDEDDNNKENIFNNDENMRPESDRGADEPSTLYCKARGTPLDHQQGRAILQFANGRGESNHGAELICSHLVCRQNGIKFRYCAYCKKAVAKRNFRKRHAHTDFIHCLEIDAAKRILGPFTESSSSSRHETNNVVPHHNQKNLKSFFPANQQQQYPPLKSLNIKVEDDDNLCSSTKSSSSISMSIQSPTEGESVPREWLNMYHRRPTQKSTTREIRRWMFEICHVAKIPSHLTPFSVDDATTAKTFDESNNQAFSTAPTSSSPYEDISSTSLKYYDQIFNEVKEEFKGIVPPRFPNMLNNVTIHQYRQHAEALSLQINTDLDIISTSNSLSLLDSDGSVMITPKYFLSSG